MPLAPPPLTAAALFTDAALLSALLIVGQIVRARVGLFQKLMLPAGLTAGALALLLGPNGFHHLPLTQNLGDYAKFLVVLVFAAAPLSSGPAERPKLGREVGEMGLYVTFGFFAQYGWGMLFSLFVLSAIWTLHPGFGYLLGVGFWGGVSTTAAVAKSFEDYQWTDAMTLGMTCSTVGTLAAIVLGLAIVNWRARKAPVSTVSGNATELGWRTGLIPAKFRKSLGLETVSNSSIESLSFHFALIMVAAGVGWYASATSGTLLNIIWPGQKIEIPSFATALLAGYALRWVMSITSTHSYLDAKTTRSINGSCVDFLIVCAIGAIDMRRLAAYAAPLVFLLLFGVLLCLYQALILGPKMFRENWFEKSILVFGVSTGTLAQGIMLLRIIDPEMKTGSLGTYALVDILIKPLTLGLIIAGPHLIGTGYAVQFAIVCSVLALIPLGVSWGAGWWQQGNA